MSTTRGPWRVSPREQWHNGRTGNYPQRKRRRRPGQALTTAEFGLSVPGTIAQPPFSMSERRSQDGPLLNATSLAAASGCCWNLSTQIGASTATTAVSARWVAIFSAVLPSVHPSEENPTTVNATAPTTAPHTAGFTPGMDLHFVTLALGEGKLLLVQIKRGRIARGKPAMVDSETTQTTPARLDCRISARIGDIVPSGAVMPVHLGAIKYDREGRPRPASDNPFLEPRARHRVDPWLSARARPVTQSLNTVLFIAVMPLVSR
jgi:hypothetical protein